MDQAATTLAQHLVDKLQKTPSNDRLLVGICGIPASGKSVFSDLLEQCTNELLEKSGQQSRAVLVGLDGWHLTRAQLDQFPDPTLAHSRRGIHWTFDGPAYLAFVKSLRTPLDASPVITAPSFDHAVKDPTPDAVTIRSHHRIVIIEGLYTCLSVDHWAEAGRLLDERCYLRLDIEEARQRLVKRHVLTGITQTLDDAHLRAEQNDMPNGTFIIENMLEPTRIIDSVEDSALKLA
ncbi:P-loop containing nucleoside triphosphate hydrolase protein [Armillaria borealis]|uniref:P-loop containing nucleoside triphosphate hydrolase protein n=1 Tax=Armillaria borealis TaxID=47425 RepID=A0AA39JES1_9AGAR|nr:P-loop containing nucleoside triphosphate hydrolase protein [Armillaria borealis]